MMRAQEYIATVRSTQANREDFSELLDVANGMPAVEIKRTGSRYVVLEASEDDAEVLRSRLGSRYEIAPNSDLQLFGGDSSPAS